MAFTLRGLGYKGLNNSEKAKEDLLKAVELSAGNLWAVQKLKEMQ